MAKRVALPIGHDARRRPTAQAVKGKPADRDER
jgi:hypothetical protein